MGYTETKEKIDSIKAQIETHGALTDEQKKKINYKFRLEWNYNSNSMEGNTLTIEETRSVMTGNLTVNEKPLKDVLEMKGHDEVITDILKIGKGELRLSEKRIKDIHKAIMYEDNESEKGKIGEWKEKRNMIYNHKGEKYDFVKPEEVVHKIHDLLNRTNAGIDEIKSEKKKAPHALDIALQFHLEYLDIHPFYDGNGRTARILTNLVLISLGYTPFWITENERKVYYNYISDIQGYGGSKELFYDYVAGLVLRSEQLVLNAVEGKNISDDDDLDKEITLFKKQLVKNDELVSRSNEAIAKLYQGSIVSLLNSFLNKMSRFDDLFDKKAVYNIFDFDNSHISVSDDRLYDFDRFFYKVLHRAKLSQKVGVGEHTNGEYDELRLMEIDEKDVRYINLRVNYRGFKNDGTNTFNVATNLFIFFNDYSYLVTQDGNYEEGSFIKKLYTENITKDEINTIVNVCAGNVLSTIKISIKKDK